MRLKRIKQNRKPILILKKTSMLVIGFLAHLYRKKNHYQNLIFDMYH